MSEKFKMKLVIDEVTTPLLYARLSAVDSRRKRATILRLLAESALHGGGPPNSPAISTPASHQAPLRHAALHPMSDPIESSAGVRELASPAGGPDNEAEGGPAHDVELIADQFAAFLG
jgi:hypothetical protein